MNTGRPPCLVTGAAGFVGAHLVRALVERGHEVHALIRPGSRMERLATVAGNVTVHRVDLARLDELSECVRRAAPEIVFHLAAETRKGTAPSIEAARNSVLGYQIQQLNLFEALTDTAKRPAVMVRAGTLAEYGSFPEPAQEIQRERPPNPYAAGIVSGTHYAAMLRDILPFRVVTARLALIYGPGQSEKFFIPHAIRAMLEGRAVTVERPNDRRDLIFVDDVIEALLRLAQAPPAESDLFNICSGRAPKMSELVQLIASATGADPSLAQCRTTNPGDSRRELICSNEHTRSIIGWTARTSLEDGLKATAQAMQTHMQERV